MRKRLLIVVWVVLSATRTFAQEGTDQLKQNADKAQQVFDQTKQEPPGPIEEQPLFPGGEKALYAFIAKETKYPPEAREQGIVGRVYVQFIVEKDGQVDSAWVKRSVHPLLDEEAIRVVRLADGWKPGTQLGKPVRVTYTMPMNFTMDAGELEKIRKKQARKAAKQNP